MSFTNKDHIITINLFNNNRYKRPICRPYPTYFSSGCQDRLPRFTHPPSFIYITEFVLVLHIAEILIV